MKNNYTIILYSFLSLFVLACNNDETNDNVPYYTFINQDRSLIINYNYTPDQIIKYQNQDGELLHFKVLLNETRKASSYSNGTLSEGVGILENHYDSKIIRMEILENPSESERAKVNYIFSRNSNRFKIGLSLPM